MVVQDFLDDAVELSTFKRLGSHSKHTWPMCRSLFSYFGAEATSFLVKTFYSNMDHVIHDIARLTKLAVDQQTAESDKEVYETTHY